MTADMLSFFGFTRPPFGPPAEPGQIFRTGPIEPVVKEILAGCNVLAVRGAPGAGKTIFMHVLATELEARQLHVAIAGTMSATPEDVRAAIGQAGGLAGVAADPETLLRALWHEAGVKRLVLLCDHAEALPAETFQTLATLIKLRLTQPTRLQVVLFGRPGPWPGLEGAELEPLQQAANAGYITLAMRADEMAAYLAQKVAYAGQSLNRVMARSALGVLREQANGNPGRLDELAWLALSHARNVGQKRLTAGLVRQALLPGLGPAVRRTPRLRLAAAVAMSTLAAVCIVAVFAQGRMTLSNKAAPAVTGPARDQPRVTADLPHAPPQAAAVRVPPAPKVQALAAVAPKQAPQPVKAPAAHAGPGLVLIAGPRDDMSTLYARVYKGVTPPPYAEVLAANQMPVKPGEMLIFPEPPHGWTPR